LRFCSEERKAQQQVLKDAASSGVRGKDLADLRKALRESNDSGIGKKVTETIAKLRNLAAFLRQEGKQLETFWNSAEESDGAKYEATRKKVWEGISALLGLAK
jgi:hypothetical protein